MRWILLICLLLSLSVNAQEKYSKAPKSCLLTKSLTVDKLIENSAIIFKGRFLGSSLTKHDGIDVRELEFEVIDPIKGLGDKKKLVLREWARVNSPFVDQINKKDIYVFFFHEPSERGLTSLNGFEQGYAIVGKQGQLKFSNRLSLKESRGFFLQGLSKEEAAQPRAEIKTYEGLKKYCQKYRR